MYSVEAWDGWHWCPSDTDGGFNGRKARAWIGEASMRRTCGKLVNARVAHRVVRRESA